MPADDTLLNQALADYQNKQFEPAHEKMERYLALENRRPDAWTLAGMIRKARLDLDGARTAYRQAIDCDADYADAYSNLANLERGEGAPDRSLPLYEKAFALRQTSAAANNVGCVLADLGRHAEAQSWHEKALALDPSALDPRWDRALALLAQGDYPNGFAAYESRFERRLPVPREFTQAAWQGEALNGRTILLYGEQGYGDALQFMRFIPWVQARGGRIVLEILPPLARLASTLPGIAEVVPSGALLPDFDVHASIMSLPHLLGLTLDRVPTTPYLQPLAQSTAQNRLKMLAPQARLRVGIVWAGNPGVKNDRFRSPRLDVLRPLWNVPGVAFFSLQKGDGKRDIQASDPIIDLDAELSDFADTASFIAALDLVITTDTSVAHLAGALGKRLWVTLMQVADWRWIGPETRSLWYPNARLFRQPARGDWARVSQALTTELHALVDQQATPSAAITAALTAYQKGQDQQAGLLIERALDLAPERPDVWTLYGMISRRQGQLPCAANAYREALRLKPDFLDAACNLGNLLKADGQLPAAAEAYRQVLAQAPEHLPALRELADVERLRGQPAQAVDIAQRALAIDADDAAAMNNLAAALSELGRHDEARQWLGKLLTRQPTHLEAQYNLGVLLHKQGRDDEAIAQFQAVITHEPGHTRAQYNLAVVLQGLGDFKGAEAAYQRAIALDPNYFSALFNLGALFSFTGRFNEALACEQRCLALNPAHLGARAEALHLAMKFCDWRTLSSEAERLAQSITDQGTMEVELPPFVLLSLPTEISEQQQLTAAKLSARNLAAGITPLAPVRIEPRPTLRIGYASSDFHDHATMHLMRGLFAAHDRTQFSIHAYSWGPDDGSVYRQQAMTHIEHFVDLRGQGAEAIAQRIRHDQIDILIDLKGYTRDCKSEIFAYRPAPVQAQYLGYPGSMGADFIDWLITDRIVTPPHTQADYSERFAYLPNSYQINDREQLIAEPQPDRSTCHLPADTMVFTCFCTHYKIEPLIWGAWMNILRAVPDSVLWLCAGQPQTEDNLRAAAKAQGIAVDRIIFGKLLPKAQHLSRLRHADLFLDTYWYNGHTTASDALWAGVPVLTLPGRRFASRVGASLVNAIGMPEMIAADLADYEAKAIHLGTNRQARRDCQEKLAAHRLTTPLFDTARFTRDIEQLYREMWQSALAQTA